MNAGAAEDDSFVVVVDDDSKSKNTVENLVVESSASVAALDSKASTTEEKKSEQFALHANDHERRIELDQPQLSLNHQMYAIGNETQTTYHSCPDEAGNLQLGAPETDSIQRIQEENQQQHENYNCSHNTNIPLDDDHDEESSNDDSSYFADPSNLPSPKSSAGRYVHITSTQQAVASREARNLQRNESDNASLSLSDDSDDNDARNGHGLEPPIIMPELFPHQQSMITRIHSVSSLVSADSHIDDQRGVIAEDHHFLSARGNIIQSGLTPSSLGQRTSSEPMPHQLPPTTILHSSYQQQQDYYMHQPHYQQQYQQQQHHQQQQQQQQQHAMVPPPPTHDDPTWPISAQASPMSKASALAYSEDSFTICNSPGPYYPHSLSHDSPSLGFHHHGPAGGHAFHDITRGGTGGGDDDFSHPMPWVRAPHDATMNDKEPDGGFRVYWQRWLMLLYMSVLNLLVRCLLR
jgi:hypothetical protein